MKFIEPNNQIDFIAPGAESAKWEQSINNNRIAYIRQPYRHKIANAILRLKLHPNNTSNNMKRISKYDLKELRNNNDKIYDISNNIRKITYTMT